MDKPTFIHEYIALAPLSGYKTGGTARFYLETAEIGMLQEALNWSHSLGLEVFFLGGGTNVLFPDESLERLVIHWSKKGVQSSPDELIVGGGETLQTVVDYALKEGIMNYAWAAGLPGSVGAAVRGNVGAFGSDISDVFMSADCLRIEKPGTLIKMKKADMVFAYRHSQVKTWGALILEVRLQLEPGSPKVVELERAKAQKNLAFRNSRHPLNYPNCGSVFKNIDNPDVVDQLVAQHREWGPKSQNQWHGKIPAAAILEAVGLKGFKLGGAGFSEMHANFIVNMSGASSRDVLGLIKHAQKIITERFGITMNPEIQILKNSES